MKNPNIFSDSGDEFDGLGEVPVEKIVINAERLRKKGWFSLIQIACVRILRFIEISRNKTRKKSNLLQDNNIVAQMRTVSQQCTLEYSSENPLSDSILDKGELMSPLSPTKPPPSMKHIQKLMNEESSSNTPMETSGTTETTAHLSTR